MKLGDLDTRERLLDSDQAAAHIGIAPDTWRAYRSRGRTPEPDTWVGRSPLWLASTVDAWQDARPHSA